jgi:glyoxylase-like metal-dependent hydrolase (beta-lactamase superfamily II)
LSYRYNARNWAITMEIERVLAPNPGLFTGPGTNTYVLRAGDSAIILDPGPIMSSHHAAILESVETFDVRAVVVTHTHPDHAPLANPLASELEVPALGHAAGPDFDPDVLLTDGATVAVGEEPLKVLHTPGHSDDHLCFLAGDLLFTGDHIMGGSTVVVEDMVAYLASLYRLRTMTLRRLYPGHGDPMDDPGAVIDEYISHRLERERQIVDAVRSGAGTIGAVVEAVYADVDPALHPLAAHSVAAHLHKLSSEGSVTFWPDPNELWRSFVSLIGAHRE